MKKIFRKSNIFSFLLGAVIFSGITGVTAYTILASDVGFTPKNNSWKVDNLSDAIDDLYAKAKPTYTGTTTFTPTTSNQVIATGNKILTSDITINAIPSTYKNLTTTTTATANDLLSGKTAYDNLGNLITGNLSNGCIVNRVTCSSCNTTSGQELADFWPSQFAIYGVDASSNAKMVWYYNDNIAADKVFVFFQSSNMETLDSTIINASYKLNNKLVIRGWNGWQNRTLDYMACK